VSTVPEAPLYTRRIVTGPLRGRAPFCARRPKFMILLATEFLRTTADFVMLRAKIQKLRKKSFPSYMVFAAEKPSLLLEGEKRKNRE
jgi:hypothetical protein